MSQQAHLLPSQHLREVVGWSQWPMSVVWTLRLASEAEIEIGHEERRQHVGLGDRRDGALQTRKPDTRRDHPLAQRLDQQPYAVRYGKILVRQGRSKVLVALARKPQHLLAQPQGKPTRTGAATLFGDQRSRATPPVRAVEPLNLPWAQA